AVPRLFSFAIPLLLPVVTGVAAEGPRWGEFPQFMAYHVLGDIHRNELVPVVYSEGEPHELRGDGARTRPGLQYGLLTGLLHVGHTLRQLVVDERGFLK